MQCVCVVCVHACSVCPLVVWLWCVSSHRILSVCLFFSITKASKSQGCGALNKLGLNRLCSSVEDVGATRMVQATHCFLWDAYGIFMTNSKRSQCSEQTSLLLHQEKKLNYGRGRTDHSGRKAAEGERLTRSVHCVHVHRTPSHQTPNTNSNQVRIGGIRVPLHTTNIFRPPTRHARPTSCCTVRSHSKIGR